MVEIVAGTALPPAGAERIAWFERTFEVVLPSSYRELLERGHGGSPVHGDFEVGHQERTVERFLCLLPSPREEPAAGWADITIVMSQIDDRLGPADETGSSLIPIAALFGGDFVCLDYRASRREPAVVVWDHERSEELEPFTVPVAPSFGAFEQLLDPGAR